ncbi:glycosyltransferase family 4 protein [Magnetococcales bacterium HHB-1]
MFLSKPRLLLFITEDWYFYSHRLPLARIAKSAGFDVLIATRMNQYETLIRQEGFYPIPLKLRRQGASIIHELLSLIEIIRIYQREKPDIVHHVALKPILYGALAARIARVKGVIHAFAGLGFVFTSSSKKAQRLRPWIERFIRLLLNHGHSRILVQNQTDREILSRLTRRTVAEIDCIPGSGVDIEAFYPTAAPSSHGGEQHNNPVTVTVVSRMLKDKGIYEFVAAGDQLRKQGLNVHLQLVGGVDTSNPSAIDPKQLRRWQKEGKIVWLGERKDIAKIWQQSDIAVLPSHREGLPKALLEAAACGRPVVTTDVPGCRDAIIPDKTGLLAEVHNPDSLAKALETLIKDPLKRQRMGMKGRQYILQYHTQERVAEAVLALYKYLLSASENSFV